jgi:D-alanine-D-alanine ligase
MYKIHPNLKSINSVSQSNSFKRGSYLISIGVLMGGRSSEHDVSLRSSSFIYNTLDRTRFRVKPILVSRMGKWFYPNDWNLEWEVPKISVDLNYSNTVLNAFIESTKSLPQDPWTDPSCGGCELIVIGLHGGEGEDGRIQAFLEMTGIAYTGSGVLASSLAMDKFRSNLIFKTQGIPVAKFAEITRDEWNLFQINKDPKEIWNNWNFKNGLNFPVFTKPTTGGSSVGTFRADTASEWVEKIEKVFESENRMLVQENIKGREVSCGVIRKLDGINWETFALPPTEIIPQSEFFNYEAKYTPGKSKEVTPPNMPSDWIQKIQEYSLIAHNVLGCFGYSRTDFIVTEDGIPWILETNTLPGMTGTSLIPQQADAIGISMKEVFTWLVLQGLARKEKQSQ